MSWSAIDAVLFASHLQSCLTAVRGALGDSGIAAVVVPAGEMHPVFQDDQCYPFKANAWFKWLVPTPPAPGSLLEVSQDKPPRLLFVAPDDYWHSPPSPPDGTWTREFDIVVVPTASAARTALRCSTDEAVWLGESPPAEWRPCPEQLLGMLEQARCRKTSHELACLRAATRIGVLGHRAAEQAFRNGVSEFDIHLAFLAATRQNESELPYPPIIAVNGHGATLHYQLRDTQPPRRPLSLLIDAGANCAGYGSDITRTWATNPGVFASLIASMHDLQQELCAAVAPGLDWRELHLRAHHLVAQLLRDAGILRLSEEEAVGAGVTATFLPHGLGHLLGVQVHDVGGFVPAPGAAPIPRPPGHPALRLTRRLEPGMVVTVEPGLYFIDSLLQTLRAGPHANAVNWTLVDTLQACGGIRIEDNVVVTASGHDNLTRSAFADVS
jgi:Xaa-Pro dipeptidase